MEGTSVQGRGVRHGRWAAAPLDGRTLTISMECERNHEWWARLILTRDDLREMLAALDERAAAESRPDDAGAMDAAWGPAGEPAPF